MSKVCWHGTLAHVDRSPSSHGYILDDKEASSQDLDVQIEVFLNMIMHQQLLAASIALIALVGALTWPECHITSKMTCSLDSPDAHANKTISFEPREVLATLADPARSHQVHGLIAPCSSPGGVADDTFVLSHWKDAGFVFSGWWSPANATFFICKAQPRGTNTTYSCYCE